MEKLILGMRDGEDLDEILKDEVGTDLTRSITKDLAQHIVELYDGKFPIDRLAVGDICIDAFGCSPCIITNINDRSIHVLYFNGKTHKFRKHQEGQFKKLNRNVILYLNKLLEIASNKAESNLRSLDQERPSYDFPIATSEEITE